MDGWKGWTVNKSLLHISVTVVVCMLVTACQDSTYHLPKPGRLEQAIGRVRFACDIPMEWPPSWPVPTGREKGREFSIMFYPFVPGEGHGNHTLYNPLETAIFNTTIGSVPNCVLLKKKLKALSSKRWPEGVSRLSVKEFLVLQGRLYDATEEAAVLYANKRELTPEAKKRIQDYGILFDTMAEPALRSYYYEMNPDFWEWMKAAGSVSLNMK